MRIALGVLIALGVVTAIIFSVCGTDEAADSPEGLDGSTSLATTSVTSATSTTSATTTTTPGDRSLVNGMPVEGPDVIGRRILAVKIDNHPRANPQSGIDQADMVIELLVEGITRYITIWHQSDSENLGPVRSGRPTDGTLLSAMGEPTYAFSGAQDWVQRQIVSRDVHLIGEVGSPQTFRVSTRSAPHNLYVNTLALREYADRNAYANNPPDAPLWAFGPMSDLADEVAEVNIDFSGNTVIWNWDDAQSLWFRTGYGEATTYLDEEGNEQPLGVPVMVALYVEQYTACPPSGVSGSCVPASITNGSGQAFVFADGRVTEGMWERETESEWFILTDENGEIMLVPPGKVWVSLVPEHRGLTYR